jgi:hypothetical protein
MSKDKVKLFTLYKENGQEMKVNEKSLEHALKLGWTEKKPSNK